MRTLKLTLSYDGTDFVGWQRQANGRSVQAVIEDALSQIEGHPVPVAGAGRTDSGVHAIGQVASATVEHAIPLSALRRAVNNMLPGEVRILKIEDAAPSFNARFDARAKVYHYRVVNGETISPFLRRFAWHVPQALDLDRMRAAGRDLIGRHDFAAFQGAGGIIRQTVRTVTRSDWLEDRVGLDHGERDRILLYQIAGDGFLRYMVRNIVGTLVDVGTGRREAGSMGDLLASKDRGAAGPTAPPQGLYLVQVDYDPAGMDEKPAYAENGDRDG